MYKIHSCMLVVEEEMEKEEEVVYNILAQCKDYYLQNNCKYRQ